MDDTSNKKSVDWEQKLIEGIKRVEKGVDGKPRTIDTPITMRNKSLVSFEWEELVAIVTSIIAQQKSGILNRLPKERKHVIGGNSALMDNVRAQGFNECLLVIRKIIEE